MQHRSVMVEEILFYLNPQPAQTVVDCTVGEGGHAVRILERIGEGGMLVGLDKDGEILQQAKKHLGDRSNVRLVQDDFCNLCELLDEQGLDNIDGLLFDLGVSSLHLNSAQRGFSFMSDGPLDMRFDRSRGETAADLANNLAQEELAMILKEYGEEPKSRPIAKSIASARKKGRISTTEQLKKLAVRATGGRHGASHAATRTFQAFRIAVNDELSSLHKAMQALPEVLGDDGRAVVISYHSLEDRIVKRAFRDLAATGRAKVLTRKPVRAAQAEVEANPRSRSAKLRALEVKKS